MKCVKLALENNNKELKFKTIYTKENYHITKSYNSITHMASLLNLFSSNRLFYRCFPNITNLTTSLLNIQRELNIV